MKEQNGSPMVVVSQMGLPQVILVSLLIVAAFLLGSLWTKVQVLEKGGAATAVPSAAVAQPQAPQPPTVDIAKVKESFKNSYVKFGDENNKLLFVEIADPSCPYCHVAAGKNGELNKQVGDRFKLVADGGSYIAPVPEMKKLVDEKKAAFAFIYYPGHGNGEMGTKAMYCGFDKGKFWEVHDLLMSNAAYDFLNNTIKNDKTKSGELAEFLKDVIDAGYMKSCLDSGKFDAQLTTDVQTANGLGISGTPGFFVNATNFAGAYSFTDMKSAVDAVIGK